MRSRKAVLQLTLDEGKDEEDGSEINAVRRRALELLGRTEDDLTDVEILARAPDELWFMDMCIEDLHRLPSEISPILTCRECTWLKARSIVKRAQSDLQRQFSGATGPRGFS